MNGLTILGYIASLKIDTINKGTLFQINISIVEMSDSLRQYHGMCFIKRL